MSWSFRWWVRCAAPWDTAGVLEVADGDQSGAAAGLLDEDVDGGKDGLHGGHAWVGRPAERVGHQGASPRGRRGSAEELGDDAGILDEVSQLAGALVEHGANAGVDGVARDDVDDLDRVVALGADAMVDGVLGQVEVVCAVLGEEPVPVVGVLCFIEAGWPLVGAFFSTRGVRVVSPRRLNKLLAESGGAVDVASVRDRLAAAFPPA